MNPENPDTTFPIFVERWRSREEIRKEYLDRLGPEELRQVSPSDYWVKYGLPAWQRECARQREAARKYDPDQPRVPRAVRTEGSGPGVASAPKITARYNQPATDWLWPAHNLLPTVGIS